ncbi:MAG: hypothetical protein D8M57_00840 [Candidatus Scalindua sp. AMX11]|nr:MAG: hypothetical protein DWQ00_18140 [Candidatus Scalindua sp.]NOG86078.1 hypothetical protein [Planctomycetota bacterium]RZV98846.1 MAG: hypothetical protein EX341_00065 [Candidatus Scalindua sp. SCAELEC01]TDE66964.1 MAG: hypothetical protein D8M57_00840 [Candidatus Scalindua sp. AMX11]GJQ57772.1 MAG: hypothetical protein SCALA701_05730 [Candidatus Scalindua sp.]
MNTETFKEVKRIELHDAGVTIFQKKYYDSTHASWKQFSGIDGSSFVIPHDAIQKIGKLFGLNISPSLDDSIRILKERQNVGNSIYQEIHGRQEIIKELHARVEAPNLLNIRVTFDGEFADEPEDHIQEVTYSGSFTVWWESPDIHKGRDSSSQHSQLRGHAEESLSESEN